MLKKEILWTPEKIASLSVPKLRALKTNAQNLSKIDIVALCEAELKRQNARGPGTRRNGRPEGEVNLQNEADGLLVHLAHQVLAVHDLSELTARAASQGIKGYRYLALLSKNGSSKLGGHQRKGAIAIDRYISYRIGNDRIALVILLAKGRQAEDHKWFLSGPKRLLPNQQTATEVIPGLDDSTGYTHLGVAFDNFDDAADKFREILAAFAPKKQLIDPEILKVS